MEQLGVDQKLLKQLRENFSAEFCVRALFSAAAEMALAVGVTVDWTVVNVDDVNVDTQKVTMGLSKLSAAGGGLLVGAQVNPMKQLNQPRRTQ